MNGEHAYREAELEDGEVSADVGLAAAGLPFEDLPSSRVPNIGHAALFLAFAGLVLFLSQLIVAQIGHGNPQAVMHPKMQLAAMTATYLVSLGACFLVFPLFWRRGFLAGVNWNGSHAIRLSLRLVSLGLSLGWCVQAVSSLIPMPKALPMDDFFRTPSDVWVVTLFGTLLAPLFEEITFRGFLLPAFTIALDWLGAMMLYLGSFTHARLKGEEPPREIATFAEDASAGLAPDTGNLFFRSWTAIALASLLSSVLFARIHSEQLAHAWGGLSILFCVSLVLTLIRVQTKSLACSTIVHASYNLSVFVTLFVATGGYRHLDKIAR